MMPNMVLRESVKNLSIPVEFIGHLTIDVNC